MARLEDEFEKVRLEIEALDSLVSPSREGRQAHLKGLIGTIGRGEDTSAYDPEEVERVRESMDRYGPAFENVAKRLAAKGGTIGDDGGWRPNDS